VLLATERLAKLAAEERLSPPGIWTEMKAAIAGSRTVAVGGIGAVRSEQASVTRLDHAGRQPRTVVADLASMPFPRMHRVGRFHEVQEDQDLADELTRRLRERVPPGGR
jgi:hypothetical protein